MAWVSVCDDHIVSVQPVQVLDLDYLDLLTASMFAVLAQHLSIVTWLGRPCCQRISWKA
jgi:hypothetical protein